MKAICKCFNNDTINNTSSNTNNNNASDDMNNSKNNNCSEHQAEPRRKAQLRSAILVRPQSMGICEMRKHKDSGEGGKLVTDMSIARMQNI